jgi:hypothetical protein
VSFENNLISTRGSRYIVLCEGLLPVSRLFSVWIVTAAMSQRRLPAYPLRTTASAFLMTTTHMKTSVLTAVKSLLSVVVAVSWSVTRGRTGNKGYRCSSLDRFHWDPYFRFSVGSQKNMILVRTAHGRADWILWKPLWTVWHCMSARPHSCLFQHYAHESSGNGRSCGIWNVAMIA